MKIAAQFNRLTISVQDLEQSAAYADRAATTSRDTLEHQALLLAAIVAYYRPFSPNEKKPTGRATASLDIAEFGSLTAGELELHERCKTLRNKALAHSEYEFNPTALDEASGVVSSRPFDLLAHAPNPAELAALAKRLANICHHWRADHIHHPAGGRSAA